MSKKKVTKVCKLQFQAGGAKPGPALASAGINMPQFCTAFNDATKDRKGDIVPVVITAYEDKSFDFVLKTTPAANLLKKAANVQKASGDQKVVAGTITVDQLKIKNKNIFIKRKIPGSLQSCPVSFFHNRYCAAGNSFSRSSFRIAVARCMMAAARRSSASPSSARIRR